MKRTTVIIAAGIGILAVTASFRYFSADEELLGVESSVHPDPSPVNNEGQSGQQLATEVAEEASSPEPNAPWVVLQEVDPNVVARLDPWLESEYLPTVKYLEQSRVVEIDGEELARRLRQSWEAQQGQLPNGSVDAVAATDLIVNLFPDVTYRMAVNRLSIAGYGTLFARAHIVEGTTEHSNVRFEINPDSEAIITVVSQHGVFGVFATPQLPYYIVTQANLEQVSRNTKFDAVLEE